MAGDPGSGTPEMSGHCGMTLLFKGQKSLLTPTFLSDFKFFCKDWEALRSYLQERAKVR